MNEKLKIKFVWRHLFPTSCSNLEGFEAPFVRRFFSSSPFLKFVSLNILMQQLCKTLFFFGIRTWSWKMWGLVSVCQSIHKILSQCPNCWLPSRELYDLQKSACWEPLAQHFYPVEPKYRFRLQKGVKNEDENNFKILNIE